jgi:para-aminobenzoate synthetase component 1
MARLRAVARRPYPVLLESALVADPLGRYSILCCDPFLKVTCDPSSSDAENLRTGDRRRSAADPFRFLSQEFSRYRADDPGAAARLPFAGGAVGYFSYDLRHRVERLPRTCSYDLDVPYFTLCFYDQGLVFDHHLGRTEWVGSEGARPDPTLLGPAPHAGTLEVPPVDPIPLQSNFSRAQYVAAVRRAKQYIAAGDIFQVNLSQRFSGPCPADGLALYARLRLLNPAPFAAYAAYPGFEIISSSPERFLLVQGDTVTTRPIKGTRPRYVGDEAFNRRMSAELRASAKDHAELAMIVDLERNDLGRVCSYGSVRVAEHAAIEAYQTVFHLVSTVTGTLHRPDHDEFSLVRAAFPGGSITGAPKIRAMEIIEELEPHARNVYTGAIGYVSFHGRMDLNIAIRTVVRMNGRVYAHFGGGIVADSDPELEYEETLHKGRAVCEALNAVNYHQIMGAAPHGAA